MSQPTIESVIEDFLDEGKKIMGVDCSGIVKSLSKAMEFARSEERTRCVESEIKYWKNIFDNPPKREREYPCDNCTKNICRIEIDKWEKELEAINTNNK